MPQPAAQAPAYNPWIGWTYNVYLFNKLYSIKKNKLNAVLRTTRVD
jgi:hypothetical protein